MTHLYIEQNNNIEVVTSLILEKLYDIASSNSIESCVLKGNLQAPHCYDYVYEYLTGNVSGDTKRFPDLSLNITDGVYISFADPVIADYWINSTYGDGEGITLASATSVTSLPKRETTINTSSELFDNYNPETNTQLNNGRYAFYKDTSITSFNELGRFTNITTIPCSAFRGSSLLHIDLSNITTIEAVAFLNANLTGVINLPKLTTWLNRNGSTTKINLDYSYFKNNPNMTEIHIGTQVPDESKITTLFSNSFYGCTNLNRVTGLSKITKIEQSVFRNCPNLENLEDLNTDSSIDFYGSIFDSCTNLKCIDVTKVEFKEGSIFRNCISLEALDTNDPEHINDNTEYTLQTSVVSGEIFRNCPLTNKTIILSNATSIGGSCFRSTKIKKVVAPNVTTLNSNAFWGCANLEELDMPNLKTIKQDSFCKCPNLTLVKFGNTANDYTLLEEIGENCFARSSADYNSQLPVPSNISYPNLKTIGSGAFIGRTEITTVSDLGTITRLPSNVFRDCTNLNSITLPNTLKEFLLDSITNTSFTYFLIPEGVEKVVISLMLWNNLAFKYVELPSTTTDMANGFHQGFINYYNDSVIMVIKAVNPPLLGYYKTNGGGVTYDSSNGAVDSTKYGAKKYSAIYVPDSALSTYQAAEGVWALQEILDRLKPISQLQTDNPTYWAIYQAGLSNS